MATKKDDFVTIASIIKREIQKRKKQKKSKDELINCIPISNASAEDETELILFKKKKKKKKRDKIMVQNENNFKNDIATLKVEQFYTETYSLFKKKKKKKKRDKKMLQNDENMNNHIGTLEVDEFYTETRDENNKHLIKDKTLDSNLSKDEFSRNINISKISEVDSLFKKKKKKKKRDKKMLQNDENMNNHIGTLEVDEFFTETCDENNKHLIKDKTLYSNLNKDEFSRNINISKISEGDSLFKKKKKKKKRDKKMPQNDENMNNHIGTLEVDEFYTETSDENNKHLIKDKTLDSNLSKDEFSRNINISKISEVDSLFKKKKKKKKRDKKMLQNDENMNNHIGTLEVDEFFTETCDENNKHLIKDKTLYSNLNKDEFSRNINISKISEGDSLFKKKKKKKKRDKKMPQNDENMNNHIGTLEVDEFYTETSDENNKHLIKDKTLDSNLSKDEFSRNINISKISVGDSLFKKKKKKKKRDKIMVQNDNNFKNDVGILKEDEFYTENCDENNKHLYLDETMDSNFSKDEFTRSISITNDSEGDLL
ncbi:unnamed protein product [Macrosiphum euphorbiae]|uniref:Uncharacterized protein n=1 Tax=Macrosiphum euphorbiae TaxID=13131 RepID=A0AAV0XDJ1_9HEMI|nr:unnamed protein product [Macrosiphum euphorbiae]